MTQQTALEVTERLTRAIIDTVADLFAEPDFDNDVGIVKFLDLDDKCVWLGLFATNDDGEAISDAPSVTWTIEVSTEAKGLRS